MANEIYKKLLKAKSNFDTILKSADNPFFKSKFADLNAIMDAVVPALAAEGLLLLQPVEGGNVVTMIVDSETGEKVVSFMPIPAHLTKPQDIGGAVTYFRRYSLQSLLGLAAEDDDGNLASGLKTEAKAKPKFTTDMALLGAITAPVAPPAGSEGFRRPIGNSANKPVAPEVNKPSKPVATSTKVWDDA